VTFAPGTKVILLHNVDRYPHFIAPQGATGTVIDVGDPQVFAVQMDEDIPGAEEWDNEVHWTNGDDPAQDIAELLVA